MSEKSDKLNAELKYIETFTNILSNAQLVMALIQLALAAIGWFSSKGIFSAIAALVLIIWLITFIAFLVSWFLHNRKFNQVIKAMDEDFNDYMNNEIAKINSYIKTEYAAKPAGALPESSNGSEIEVPKASIQ